MLIPLLCVVADVPDLARIIVMYKEKILNAKETLTQLIQRNNELRQSVDMVLFSVTRQNLKRIELAFKPGLSTVTWTSEHLDEYFDHVRMVRFLYFCLTRIDCGKCWMLCALFRLLMKLATLCNKRTTSKMNASNRSFKRLQIQVSFIYRQRLSVFLSFTRKTFSIARKSVRRIIEIL